jgi:hypothetical protein
MRGAYGTRIQTQLYLIIVPADGTGAATVEKRRLRYVAAFIGQLSDKQAACLYSITWGVGRKAQEGSDLGPSSVWTQVWADARSVVHPGFIC